MKFVFLDLEAIPETKEVISVGVCYDDKEFYSLVKPADVNMLNEHVSGLTGLTKEDLSNAPELKDVLDNLFSWLPEKYRVYVYGKFDRPLLKRAREKSQDNRLDFFLEGPCAAFLCLYNLLRASLCEVANCTPTLLRGET